MAPYRVNVGLRWAGDGCDVIRQGDHITIFSRTTLVRALTADPAREYQPSAPNTAYLPQPRTKTAIMSVSDVPRHHSNAMAGNPARFRRGVTFGAA